MLPAKTQAKGRACGRPGPEPTSWVCNRATPCSSDLCMASSMAAPASSSRCTPSAAASTPSASRPWVATTPSRAEPTLASASPCK